MQIFQSFILLIATLSLLEVAHASANITKGYSVAYKESLHVHYGVFKPDTRPIVGDVLYLHGYGDRFDNHVDLFKSMTDAGLRVIAFDFPSHGLTYGGKWDDLNWLSFDDLAELARVIEHETLEDSSRPLLLSGWSTGGLLALRMAQKKVVSPLSRALSGLLLFAPAVAVPLCVGEGFCQITNATLTHDTARYDRKVMPISPLLRPKFAVNLLFEASQSWQPLPANIPTLIWTAGTTEDRYINTEQLKSWVGKQRAMQPSLILAAQCLDAMHELDNETESFGAQEVRAISAEFLRRAAGQEALSSPSFDFSICRQY